MDARNALPTAVDRLTAEWEGLKQPYYRVEREYFSCGSVIFEVDGDGTSIKPTGAYDKYILRAAKGQQANLFSYKSGDPGSNANMLINNGASGLITDDSHTNLRVGYQTNGEDFAIMGVSFRVKGFRIESALAQTGDSFPDTVQNGTSSTFRNGILQGSIYLWDVSTDFVPPELQSPLVLEDNFGRSIAKVLDLRELWNQKEGDQIALADSLGPAGGESYLHTLGEPSTWNYRKMSKGLIWRNAGTEQSQDTNFALGCTTLEDIWQKVTWPGPTVFPSTGEGETFPALTRLHVDYKLTLHGVAFYKPSQNR
jgi:hypothetical protein